MENIKDKIKKLLALAGSPNEHEAKAALLKAKELMAKNKIEESDLGEVREQELKKIECNITWTTDSGKIWLTSLCKVLCDNYLCSASWATVKGSRTHKLVIAGIGEDADICKEVVEYVVDFVESAINHLQRRYARQDPKSIANSYAEGFIFGLELAFEDQQEDHPEWALVVVKPDQVNEYEKNLGSKNVRTKQTDFSPLAYMKGQVDGKNFNPRAVLQG